MASQFRLDSVADSRVLQDASSLDHPSMFHAIEHRRLFTVRSSCVRPRERGNFSSLGTIRTADRTWSRLHLSASAAWLARVSFGSLRFSINYDTRILWEKEPRRRAREGKNERSDIPFRFFYRVIYSILPKTALFCSNPNSLKINSSENLMIFKSINVRFCTPRARYEDNSNDSEEVTIKEGSFLNRSSIETRERTIHRGVSRIKWIIREIYSDRSVSLYHPI